MGGVVKRHNKKDENRKPRKKETEGQKPRKGVLLVPIQRDTQKTEKRQDKKIRKWKAK